jgi:hypothetical protein
MESETRGGGDRRVRQERRRQEEEAHMHTRMERETLAPNTHCHHEARETIQETSRRTSLDGLGLALRYLLSSTLELLELQGKGGREDETSEETRLVAHCEQRCQRGLSAHAHMRLGLRFPPLFSESKTSCSSSS